MKTSHKEILPNGLTILGEYNPASESVAIGYFVKTGSRDETPKESGVSHFLEHMMFKGTATRSALDISYELGSLGAQANAFTSEEMTVYYGAVLAEQGDKFLTLLSDMLRPALDLGEFTTEKNVILEEIALYQDKPHFMLFERAAHDYFNGHPAGNSVLGSKESITALTRDEMHNYFIRRYTPKNTVLVLSGKFSWNDLVARARETTGAWEPFEAARVTDRHALREPISREYTKPGLARAHVVLKCEGPSALDEERIPFGVLTTILGDSSGSRLYWDLVDSGIADSAQCDADERDGAGVFYGYASSDPERIEEVTERMRRILTMESLSKTPITDDELRRAKKKLATRVVLSGESTMGRMMALGNDWLYRGRVESLTEIVKEIESVSLASINGALKRFPTHALSTFTLRPA